MNEIKPYPEPIKREGPYKVYKGHKYTVYDDGNSAETPYQTDLAEAYRSRLVVAVEALKRRSHHYICEDCWYSCPKSGECCNACPDTECNCGADAVLEAISAIGELSNE